MSTMKILSYESVKQAQSHRPSGYIEDLLQSGTALRNDIGDIEYIAFTDKAFSELQARYSPEVHDAQTHGPGAELSKLLKRLGIEPTPTCKCRSKAAQMDAWGCDECAKPERIDEVVAVMREEAKARSLPFLDAAGRVLVRRAISNARREQARATQAATAEGSDEA
jgi:hypothetical protein